MGRDPDDPNLMQMGYRYLVIENYLVFYVLEARVVIIHRILHSARNYRDLVYVCLPARIARKAPPPGIKRVPGGSNLLLSFKIKLLHSKQ